MTQFNEFLNLLSEAKKESKEKETVLTEKIKNNSFFDLLMNVEISNEQLGEEIEQVYQETDSQTVESILETVIDATKEQIVEKFIDGQVIMRGPQSYEINNNGQTYFGTNGFLKINSVPSRNIRSSKHRFSI